MGFFRKNKTSENFMEDFEGESLNGKEQAIYYLATLTPKEMDSILRTAKIVRSTNQLVAKTAGKLTKDSDEDTDVFLDGFEEGGN